MLARDDPEYSFLFDTSLPPSSYASFASCSGFSAERTGTMTLLISAGSMGPAGREFAIGLRLLAGRGT